MGINRLEERLGEAGKLRVELQMDAGGEPGEAFKEALDIGVGTDFLAVLVEGKASGDFGKFTGELTGHFAQMAELIVVMVQQPFIHWRHPPGCTGRSPDRFWS